MRKKLIIMIGLAILLTVLMNTVAAYTIPDELRPFNEPFDIGSTLESQGGAQGAATGTILVLQILAGGLLFFAAPIAIIFILISAWTMTVGGADSEKLEQSKKSLMWAIAGLIVIILSYSIVRVIINIVIKAASTTPTPT